MSEDYIEDEHRQLYQVIDMVKSIIQGGQASTNIGSAIGILRQRLSFHFEAEERLAGKKSTRDVANSLHDDHQRLLGLVDQLAVMAEMGDIAGKDRLFAQFLDALAQHDREFDGPVFRAIAAKEG